MPDRSQLRCCHLRWVSTGCSIRKFSTESEPSKAKIHGVFNFEPTIVSPRARKLPSGELRGGNMRLRRIGVIAFLTGCMCLPVLAQQVDNVTFSNSDGMFNGTSLSSGSLTLNNSTLIQISGFTGGLGGFDTTGANLGTLTFTTGPLNFGSMVPTSGHTSTFGGGGSFTLTDTFNGGFTFTGTFTSASWQCIGTCKLATGKTNQWKGTWQFNGTLSNVVLTVNGQQIPINGAVTFQGTAFNTLATTNSDGSISFTDTGGTTNFNVTVVPEPGTLALFGSGLIGVGVLAKFSRQRKRHL